MAEDHGVARGLRRAVAEGDRLVEDHGQAIAGAKGMALAAEQDLDRALQHPDLLVGDPRPIAALVGHARACGKDHLDDLAGRGKAWRRDVATYVARGGVAPFDLVLAA